MFSEYNISKNITYDRVTNDMKIITPKTSDTCMTWDYKSKIMQFAIEKKM